MLLTTDWEEFPLTSSIGYIPRVVALHHRYGVRGPRDGEVAGTEITVIFTYWNLNQLPGTGGRNHCRSTRNDCVR